MSNREFLTNLLTEIDRVMVAVDQIAERAHQAATTARSLLELAQRYVKEGEGGKAADSEILDVLVRAEHVVHRDQQRSIEQEEQRIEREAAKPLSPDEAFHIDRQGNYCRIIEGAAVPIVPQPSPEEIDGMLWGRTRTKDSTRSPSSTTFRGIDLADLPFAAEMMAYIISAEQRIASGGSPAAERDRFERALKIFRDETALITDPTKLPPATIIGVDLGRGESFSSGVDDALKAAYDAPIPDLAAGPIASGKIDVSKIDVMGLERIFLEQAEDGTFFVEVDGVRKPLSFGPTDEIAARDDAGLTDYDSMMKTEDPLPSPGEEKTEAADVAPQPEVAASVDALDQAVEEIILSGEHFETFGEEKLYELPTKAPDNPNAVMDWMSMRQGAEENPPAVDGQTADPEAGQEEASSTADDRGEAKPAAEPPPPAPREPEGRKIAPQFGMYEEVLNLWATTDKTEMQIARATNATISIVRTYLQQARADGDERIEARHKGKLKDKRALKVAPQPNEEDPMPPVKGNSAEPPRMPFTKSKDVEIGEYKAPESGDLSTGICVVDRRTKKIYGNKGYWTATPEICTVVAFLNKGDCFGVGYIATQCGWDTTTLIQQRTSMMERLRDIGIQLTDIPGIGWHMKKAD